MQSIINRVFIFIVLILVAGEAFAQSSVMTTVAGTGTAGYNGDGRQATTAQLNGPFDVAVDAGGNLYIAEWYNNRVRKVNVSTGIISTIAGNGGHLFSGDGGPATQAELNSPEGLAIDAAGNIYISDSLNHRVRKVSTSGIITTIAGTGSPGFNGDGPARSAELNDPAGLVLDSSASNLYIADQANHRIRRLNLGSGLLTTIVGTGNGGYGGDGGPAVAAQVYNPTQMAVDSGGNIFIADTYNHRVRRISASGTITTVAGTGKPGFSGDGGSATSAQLNNPTSVALDSAGHLYIGDAYNGRIRQVSGGIIRTIAGDAEAGCGSTSSSLNFPLGMNVNGSGDRIYIADFGGNTVKLLAPGAAPAAPSLTSLSPATGEQATTHTVTLTGSGFLTTSTCSVGGTTVSVSGTGVTAADVKVTSNTSMTATFTVAPGAAVGARSVTVTTASGTTSAKDFTVTMPVPTLTSVSPAAGLRGSTVAVTLTGTKFEPGSTTVAVSGSGITVSNVNASSTTSLTATFTIAPNAPQGNYNVTVATTNGGSSNAMPFAVNPAGPAISYNIPRTLNPTEQVAMQLAMATPSPDPVTGKLTLTFTSDAVNNADDPSTTFINSAANARTVNFTFPPNSTTAQFSLAGVQLKAGTVSGGVRLTMSEVKVGAKDVTPTESTFDVVIPRGVPVITSMKIVNKTAAGFDVEVTGYSTSRDITVATFQFAAASGASLETAQLQPDVAGTFTEYYVAPKSFAVGSVFLYVQPFIVQQGDVNAVGSVTLTLTNAQGVSAPASAQ
jgi:sugar lactone lactonase YvrE